MKNRIKAALGAAALAAAFMPTGVFAYWTGGYEVIIDGKSVANVKNAAEVTAMVAVVNDQLGAVYGAESMVEPEIELKAKILASEKLSEEKTLHDAIASLSKQMCEGLRITVDGRQTICVRDYETLSKTLDYIIEQLGVEGADSSVTELVGAAEEIIPEGSLYSAEEAAEYFINNKMINVKSVVRTEKTVQYIPEAVRVPSAELYEGVEEKVDSGRAGTQIVTDTGYYINSELIKTGEQSEVIDYGESATIMTGTKKRPEGVGTGSFIVPASGKLTSSYGARWGRMHNGIDIGAPTGTPVYASDDGVVSCSEYKNSFGNIVKIDHGNGYETYYAHNSELLVSCGETVKKGQLIAKVGSTGNSTGPHCHFEIHYNGETKNPSEYLK